MEAVKVSVRGRVQGVGFRYTCLHHAQQLNLAGYVKNVIDGSVEVFLQGARADIDAFLSMLQEGHSFPGFVGRVDCENCPPKQYSDFSIR